MTEHNELLARLVAALHRRYGQYDGYTHGKAAEHIIAELDAAGFAVVPKDATEEMLRACAGALKSHIDGMAPETRAMFWPGGRRGILVPAKLKAQVRWRAMVEAARAAMLAPAQDKP